MTTEPDNLRYYRSLVGDWSGTFALRVVRPGALKGTSFLTRLIAFAARFGGSAHMATTLREQTPDRFHHTTLVTRFGIPLLRSSESISLSPDGTSFVIEGWQQFLWLREPYRGEGHIRAGATGAHYPISWLRAPMTQATQVEGTASAPALRLRQETAWSAGEVLLKRQP